MPDYRYNSTVNGLQSLLSATQPLSEAADARMKQRQFEQQQAQQRAMPQIEADVKRESARQALSDVLKHSKEVPPGSGLSEGAEGASFTKPTNMGVYDFKKQQMDQSQANKYAKGLEKYSDLTGAAADLERITNRDGSGGIFTNPKASLVSGGKIKSSIPDAAMGLAELVHAAPQGSAEERKALSRYKLAMGHALTGARMNPTMQKMIQDSLGGMASGDPQLMAKGLRGSARIIGGTVKTVQGGFTPEVRGQVHEEMGMDPMELFGRIPSENEPPSNYNSPPAESAQQPQPVQQKPLKMSPQQRMQYLLDKKAGKVQ